MNNAEIIGCVAFIVWMLSYYFYLLEMIIRRHTKGLSFDMILLLITAFFFYSVFVTIGYAVKSYSFKISIVDLVFAYHNLIFSLLFLFAPICLKLRAAHMRKQGRSPHPSLFTMIGIPIIFLIFLILIILQMVDNNLLSPTTFNFATFSGLSVYIALILRNVPQIYYCFKSKSVVGWNPIGVALDLSAGVFILVEEIWKFAVYSESTDYYNFGILGGRDVLKIIVGAATIGTDTVLLIQTFYLFRSARSVEPLQWKFWEKDDDISANPSTISGPTNTSITILDPPEVAE